MNFYKTNSPDPVAEIIADKISSRLLDGQKIFWLVTGGSAIKIEAKASSLLNQYDLSNLIVTLTDERFGPIGHRDSNWFQLEQAGFELPGAKLLPVLTGNERQKSTKEFAKNLKNSFAECDYCLGIFGIGPDGHVAGILPGSPDIKTSEMAVGYDDEEVKLDSPEGVIRSIDRITMSAAAIARLDEAIVCAFGETKHTWLDKLEEDLPIEQNPAQALKQAGNLLIYNDYKGEDI